MAGRKDFGILRSSFGSDDRATRAADLYAERGFAREDIALGAVAGHIVQLGLWAMRETDDGVLPRDGVGAVQEATKMSRSACREVIATLTEAGLLRPCTEGFYLVGFVECYEPVMGRRIEEARRKREQRDREAKERKDAEEESRGRHADAEEESRGRHADAEEESRGRHADAEPETPCHADVTRTSRLARAGDRAVPGRTVPDPTEPPRSGPPAGAGAPNGEPQVGDSSASPPSGNGRARPVPFDADELAKDDLIVATEIARVLRGSDVADRKAAGEALWQALRDQSSTPPQIRDFVDRWQHEPDLVATVEKHRRISRMTDNGRKRKAK